MIFSEQFNDLEKIQLLQRAILVDSFAYYELNANLLSDYQYDMNAKQLAELRQSAPEAYRKSAYYGYFRDFCSEDGNQHYTSGFDLLQKVEKKDPHLYRHIWIDAMLALKLKDEGGVT